jgi:two-component system chemotaxis response regulator CheV
MSSVMDSVNQLTQLAGSNRFQLLMFHLDGRQRYGINVFKVREIIKCPPLTKMPSTHYAVYGITTIRGKTITVIDLATAIGLPPLGRSTDHSLIVTEYNRQVQGFLVGGVDRIVNKKWEEIHLPPKNLLRQCYMTAVTSVEDNLVEIVDVEKVLAETIGVRVEISADLTRSLTHDSVTDRKILVADDSSVARKQILKVLDQLNVDYIKAENGREAWDILQNMCAEENAPPIEQRLAMVISDIEMPEMDGYTLTKQIKAHPLLSKLYVCLHSSLTGSFNESMVKRVGADNFIAKFDPNDLANLILSKINETN